MVCNKYCDCQYCSKDNNCSLYHMGDGTPWCRKFECMSDNCKRSECISYEEELEEVMNGRY